MDGFCATWQYLFSSTFCTLKIMNCPWCNILYQYLVQDQIDGKKTWHATLLLIPGIHYTMMVTGQVASGPLEAVLMAPPGALDVVSSRSCNQTGPQLLQFFASLAMFFFIFAQAVAASKHQFAVVEGGTPRHQETRQCRICHRRYGRHTG